MSEERLQGSCLCGAVRFELDRRPEEVLDCHCRMCQKAHGAGVATFAVVANDAFEVVAGADHIASYRSSEHARRTFRAVGGSTLQSIGDGRGTFGLALSALDSPFEPSPIRDVHTESRVDWLDRSR